MVWSSYLEWMLVDGYRLVGVWKISKVVVSGGHVIVQRQGDNGGRTYLQWMLADGGCCCGCYAVVVRLCGKWE